MAVVEIAKREEIPAIVAAMHDVGLGPTCERLERFFFDSSCSRDATIQAGGLVVKDGTTVVGYLGMAPFCIFCNQRRYDGYCLGVLGLKSGYGTCLFDLIDKAKELAHGRFLVANTANAKSAKLWVGYGNCVPGPEGCAYIHYELLPSAVISWMPNCFKCEQTVTLEDPCFRDFWDRFRGSRCKLFATREPEKLTRIFGSGIDEGRLALLTIESESECLGYAVLKKKKLPRLPFKRYEVLDAVVVDDELELLKKLIGRCKSYARRHGGLMLEYIGGSKKMASLFSRKRPAVSNTSFWWTDMPELSTAFATHPDSFFGPYDGDRCL